MKENMLSTMKKDGQVFFKLVKLATDIGKLKLNIRSKGEQKEKLVKTIGLAVWQMYSERQAIDDHELQSKIGDNLYSVQKLSEEMTALQARIAQVRQDFKGGPGENAGANEQK